MKKPLAILVIGLVAALAFTNVLRADDRPGAGELRGTFVRLTEAAVGERGYLGLVIKPFEQDEHVTVLVPRQPEEVANVARRLREGQTVEIAFVTEEGHKWLTALDAEWRDPRPREDSRRAGTAQAGGEGERAEVRRTVIRLREDERPLEGEPRRTEEQERRRVEQRPVRRPAERAERQPTRGLAANLERLAMQFRQLAEQVQRMESELRDLRAENERLRGMLRERGWREEGRERRETERPREGRERAERDVRPDRPDRQQPPLVRDREQRQEAPPSLPDGMAGFRGVLIGRLVRKLDRGLLLKVERLGEVWEHSRAANPEAAVGKELMIAIRVDQDLGEQFLSTLRRLEIGQRVLVEAFHVDGNHLTVVEQLRPVD